MNLPMILLRLTAVVAGGAAAAGSGLVTATPAHACSTNAYRVVWPVAGVYDQMNQSSYRIMKKKSGQRVTGPTGWGHVRANGHRWTKVWIYSRPGWREGWMRDDAVTFTGCH